MSETLLTEKKAELTVELDVGQLLADRVLALLGRPSNLFRVDVRHLWGDNFRVNVYVREGNYDPVPTVRIADSFFVRLGTDGMEVRPNVRSKY